MANTIVIFTLNGCSHCHSLKERLDEINIPYLDVEITQNEKIWEQVVEQTGEDLIPTVFIKQSDSDDGYIYIPGKDFQSEDEIVEKIKKHYNEGV
jgi:glutaredoxin